MTVECRRCRRPLRGRLAVAAGVGARCALLEVVEAAESVGRVLGGREPAPAAVALITALLSGEEGQVQPLLDEADPRDVAVMLATVHALYLADFPDGLERLRRAGLAVAEGVC